MFQNWIRSSLTATNRDSELSIFTHLSKREELIHFRTLKKMLENCEKRGRGRPKTHPVDRLRTKVWYHFIARRFVNLSAYKLERITNPDRVRRQEWDGRVIRPGAWDRYREGKQIPNDNHSTKSIVARTDRIFRNSAEIFRSSIWAILKGHGVDSQTIMSEIDGLGEISRFNFLEAPEKFNLERILVKDFSEQNIQNIRICYLFDTFRCIILMVGYFENVRNIDMRNRFSDLYRSMIPDFIEEDEVPFFHEFFDTVDRIAYRCEFRRFNTPHKQFISWRELYPSYAARQQQTPLKSR